MKTIIRKPSFLATSQKKFLHLGFIASIALVIAAFKIPLSVNHDSKYQFPKTDAEDFGDYILPPLPPENKPQAKVPEKIVQRVVVQQVNILTDINPPEIDNQPEFTEPDIPLTLAPEVFVDNKPEPPRIIAEKMPTFKGGETAMFKFLNEKIKYCNAALSNDMQGVVHVRFIIDTDGSIKDAEIAKGLYPCLDKSALEAVKSMPKWNPAEHGNRKVPVIMVLPVSFKLRS